MQTPYSSIANQTFSVSAYRHLRESLINQRYFFDTVTTAAQPAASMAAEPIAAESYEKTSSLGQTQSTSAVGDIAEVDFVLMRSPTVDVLLTATPLVSSSPTASSTITNGEQISLRRPSASNASAEQAHYFPKGDSYHTSLNSLPFSQQQSNIHHAPYDDHTPSYGASLSKSEPRSKLEKAAKRHNLNSRPAEANSQKADRYLVNLTLDKNKIKEIMTKLRPSSTVSNIVNSKNSFQPTDNSHLEENNPNYLSHEAFFLSWAKDLATSPEGDHQPDQPNVFNNEMEQSLLLNQVITRIRQSLDLSSILETTVAQVREFLSADRLVLYQFNSTGTDQSSVGPSASNHSALEIISQLAELNGHKKPIDNYLTKATSRKHSSQRSAHASPNSTHQTDNANTDNAIIGQQVHTGQVTYESRRSKDILSTLNFSEESCFHSTLPTYSHYLTGRPIAIDNVHEKYADAGCLLDFLDQTQVKSKIIAPILVKNQLWGLLIAHQCKDYRHWQKTETVFLQNIAEHLAVAIEQASLHQLVQQQKLSLESCVIERTQSLQDALALASAADRTKGEFLSTMSHELRTPLTYIIGMSATLLRWSFGELSERQRSYLDTINHSGEQLLTVINDILEFAKVESGRSLLNVSDFPLSELVRSVGARYQKIADDHNVALTIDCVLSPEIDNFRADFKRIEQILSNLVNNAIKFTPAGGQVCVRVQKDSDNILLQVEDTGIGIPESKRKFLFEKFKQLESPFQRQYAGTGLGLAMTKQLVELHDGTIQVISTVGKGSTFIVSLPIRSKPALADRYHVPSTLEQITKPVVLLLETEENSAVMICELLTADGYEVIWLTPRDDIAVQVTLLKPALLIADLSLLGHQQSDIKAIEQSIMAVGARVLALLGEPAAQSSHIAHHNTLDKPINPKDLIEKSRQLTSTVV